MKQANCTSYREQNHETKNPNAYVACKLKYL